MKLEDLDTLMVGAPERLACSRAAIAAVIAATPGGDPEPRDIVAALVGATIIAAGAHPHTEEALFAAIAGLDRALLVRIGRVLSTAPAEGLPS